MQLFDFCYYLSFKAYERGNSTKNGAFLLSSLWISLLHFMWLFIILSPIEIYTGINLFPGLENFYLFALYIIILIGLNNIYLNYKNRKKIILTRFKFSKKEEIFYFIFLIFIFFISIYISVYVAGIKY